MPIWLLLTITALLSVISTIFIIYFIFIKKNKPDLSANIENLVDFEQGKLTALLNSALESWPYEFWVSDMEGRCIIQNHTSQLIWGNLIGKTLDVLNIPEDIKKKSIENGLKALQGETSSTEYEFNSSNGKRFVLFNLYPVKQNNAIIGYLGIGTDITERKLAEEKIRISEENYRLLAENIDDVIWKMDINTLKYTYISPSIFKLTGYTIEESKELTLEQMLMPDSFEQVMFELPKRLTDYQNGISGAKVRFYEFKLRCKNGSFVWVEMNTSFIVDENGKPKEISATSRNITSRKLAETALRESEKRLRTIYNTSKDGIVLLNKKFEIIDINPSALKKSEYSREELIGKNVNEILIQNKLLGIQLNLESIWYEDVIDNFETEIKIKNDGIIPVEISATTIHLNNQDALLLMIRDISERKQLEKELLNSVIKTEEKERLNFSQELHDGLGPLLSAAKMYIDWLGKPNANVKKEELIPEIKMLLEEAGNSIRDISFKLSPHILQNYGIIEALKAYSQKIMSSGKIKITLNNNPIPRLPEVTETVIYRVICECITNTIKHAKAHSIIINFNLESNLLSISYSDDGIGFDVEGVLVSKKGIGLLNMQSRLKSINGQISITSILQKGTTIYLQTPYF